MPGSHTKSAILNAAQNVFMMKGYDGARMQEIADKAGINKAMLHYYYHTKYELFKEVFYHIMDLFLPVILKTVEERISMRDKISIIVDSYMNFFSEYTFIPAFIMREMTQKPDWFTQYLKSHGVNPPEIFHNLKEKSTSTMDTVDMEHLIVNILSLCIFPVAATPVLKEMLFDNRETEWERFIKERKQVIKEVLFNAYNL
jgi:AcrR family transcriptional regulator